MRKGRILLTGLLLGSLFLSGCSRNSSLQVVVPKKEQESVLLSQGDEGSVQEQVQAPVRYLCDKDFSNFRLLANARVIVPEVEGIRLKKIKSRKFAEEDLQRIRNTLLKDSELYELRQENSYEEMEGPGNVSADGDSQASLQKKKVDFTAGTGTDSEVSFAENGAVEAVVTEENGNSYEELYSGQTETVIPETPEGYEACRELFLDFLDGKKTFYFNTQADFSTLYELFQKAAKKEKDWKKQLNITELSTVCYEFSEGVTEGLNWEKRDLTEFADQPDVYGMDVEKDSLFSFSLQNYTTDGSPVQFRVDPAYGDVFSIQDAEQMVMGNDEAKGEKRYHEENLAVVDFQKQGRELMKGIGLDQTELWEVQEEKIFWWTYLNDSYEQAEVEPARKLTYCRSVDGVPVIRTSDQAYCEIQEEGLMKWPEEEISVVYGEDGLLSFNWMAPVEIEDWQDDYAFLLPFSEISQIFEEMLEGSLTIDAGVLTGDLNISEVRLGYVRVISKDLLQEDTNISTENGQEVYAGVLVPAWSFIGTATGSVAEAYGVEEGTRISYMTINATDGSIIGN